MAGATKKLAGFGSVGQNAGSGWWARYTRNGQMHRPGRTFATEKLAIDWLTDERKLIDTGTWTPPAQRRAAEQAAAVLDELTLGSYARDWVDKRVTRKGAPLHPRTRADYLGYLDGPLAPLSRRPLAAIAATDVERWHSDAGGAPATRHKAYAFLRSVMASAHRSGLVKANPCAVQNATRKPPARHNTADVVKWLTHERVRQIADLVQPRDRLLILLCAYCCLRTGEAFALRRSDLELGTGPDGLPFGWLTVERGISTYDGQRHEGATKTGQLGNRVVPVPPHLVADLRAHVRKWAAPGPDGLLFPSTNPSMAFRTANQVCGNAATPKRKNGSGWYEARRISGRPDAHLHDLRHWGATLWDEAGTPAGLRTALMGHAQPGMTGHYTHPDTRKASPYAMRVSQLAGWSPTPAPVPEAAAPAGALAGILAALDDSALSDALAALDAAQLSEVVPQLPAARVAVVLATLAGQRPTLRAVEG